MNMQYREPKSAKELESLFRLRYLVYSEDQHLHKMIDSSSGYDINQYDLNAFHFAAFEDENPIAYIRITNTGETHFTSWVNSIVKQKDISIKANSHPYPFQSYYPDPDWSIDFISGLKGRKIGEVGKLAIHRDYRQAGQILDNFIEAFIAYCKNVQQFDTGFGSCSLVLERYYRKFGFKIADGAQSFIYDDLPEAIIVRFDR